MVKVYVCISFTLFVSLFTFPVNEACAANSGSDATVTTVSTATTTIAPTVACASCPTLQYDTTGPPVIENSVTDATTGCVTLTLTCINPDAASLTPANFFYNTDLISWDTDGTPTVTSTLVCSSTSQYSYTYTDNAGAVKNIDVTSVGCVIG
uniref:C6 domain-containing protein n=1 Tax=Rhabditophanes sp. KR3021 TaxID=114890 RepID=A0AC35TLH1_9BILA